MRPPANDAEILVLGQELRSAIGRIHRRFRTLRAQGELGDAAISVLARLRKEGDQSLTELSDEARVTPSSMSQVVNRLAAGGYLVRRPDPVDGRRVLFRLTEEGRRVEQASTARGRAWFDAQLGAVTDEERRTLTRAAQILTRIAESDPPDPA
jgi:DNA-binding MarR family transcriptional regulator